MAFRWWSFAGAVCLVAAAAWAGGCGNGSSGDNGNNNDGGPLGGDGGPRGDSGTILFGGDSGNPQGTLAIMPQGATLDVMGSTNTLQYTATLNGQPTVASWTVGNAQIGTINGSGLFTASGMVGGVTTIYANAGNQMAQAQLTVRLHISDNPGNVPGGTQGMLQGGGNADSGFKWLYPYDKTVFPRGLLAPELQFAGTTPDYIYVHVTSQALDYKGFYAGNSARVRFTQALWQTITETAGQNDPVTLQVTKISGGAVSGPITESWNIAQGSLKGTVYYNSYNSALGGGQGAVLRIQPGSAMPTVLLGQGGQVIDPANACTVCHAVSAKGNVIVASDYTYTSGTSRDLTNGAALLNHASSNIFSFGALYPDGTFEMSQGNPGGSWPPNVPGMESQGPSRLYDTKTGNPIAAPSWDNAVTYGVTPVFSQDGKRIAFDHYDTGSGHTLAVMDFALNAVPDGGAPTGGTFSNLVDVAQDPAHYLGWPAFLPDSNWVLFHADTGQDYATWQSEMADIMIAHIPSKTVVKLNTMDGYDGAGTPNLPTGAGDVQMNYEPTVLPVAVGGYYWAVFTSRRQYGNEITSASGDGWANQARKKLWVVALDVDDPAHPSTAAKDLSHPAFYLEGQEFAAGNMRGFWALSPCVQNGTNCSSGDECCSGFCRSNGGADGGGLSCVAPPSGCANEFEHCTTSADCCGQAQGYECINGYCARPPPK
jgi:hypothetical protein